MEKIEKIVAEFQPEHLGIWIKIAEKMGTDGKILRSDPDVQSLEQDKDFERMMTAGFLVIEENQNNDQKVVIAPVQPRQMAKSRNSFVVLKQIGASQFLELLKEKGVGTFKIATAGG